MSIIEKRYAEALIGISLKDGALDMYQSDLQSIVDIYEQHPELKEFLLNPEVKADGKKEAVRRIFEGKTRVELVNFLMLLLDRSRFSYLPGILKEFISLADVQRNTLKITIISSKPLDEIYITKIKAKYGALYNTSSVNADFQVDPSLIGGIKVKIGDKVYDNSLKGRLDDLKELIAGS